MRDRNVTVSGPGFALLALIVAFSGRRILSWLFPDVLVPWPLAYGLPLAVAFVFGKLALRLAKAGHEIDDTEATFQATERALEAEKVLGLLREGQPPPQPIVLYLRPFVSDGAMALKNPIRKNAYTEPEEIDFQEFLARLEWPGEFIAIGEKDLVPRGATKLFVSDAEWKDAFQRLADVAILVIVVPHYSQSCIYEMEMLRHWDYLSKTIFVMPPTLDGDMSTFDAETEWEKARESFGRLDLTLPDYSSLGLLFRLGSDGAVLEQDEFHSPLLKGRKSILERIFSTDSQTVDKHRSSPVLKRRKSGNILERIFGPDPQTVDKQRTSRGNKPAD